ncbi:MAG TPA: 5-methyltetrahydrofolate--homocysteine methyltransferase [Bacteroides clarus]|uniref:vitamin B12 dependent-methionine synthase activation domain-containing protein n=1 Tax=Bacteroides clarus TaxID=626929 RepID=UPI0018A9A543|nr:vitamin B12 dependent-methionine synthase activation domain-containing protein [Bacteroides clarus]HJF99903.1 5-methyltetrahydrofolate--homocysteine methyltransferase [Bacteroides clarus]
MSTINYKIHEVSPYINWIYFFHAWGFQPKFAAIADIHGCDSCRAMWLAAFPQEERAKAAEAMQLFKEANRVLNRLDEEITVQCIYRLCNANAEGDNLLIEDTVFPLLRQQTPHPDGSPFLCLSDFIRPLSFGVADTIGLFASSVSTESENYYKDDPYKHLLVQTLTDRLAEAATEKMHEHVRKAVWGYAPDESLSIPDLLAEKYQGIRPAVGYPSLPDQSVNFILDELLDMKQIGITLTENGAMYPHASVCGLMFSHPRSHYFAVGKIGEDQLEDYARRRGKPIGEMRKFLAANLKS